MAYLKATRYNMSEDPENSPAVAEEPSDLQQQRPVKRSRRKVVTEDPERKRRKKEVVLDAPSSPEPLVPGPTIDTPAPPPPPPPTSPPPPPPNLFLVCTTKKVRTPGERKTSYFIAAANDKEDVKAYVQEDKAKASSVVNTLAVDSLSFSVIDNVNFFDPNIPMPISQYLGASLTVCPDHYYICDLTSLIFPGSAAVVFRASKAEDTISILMEFIVVYFKSKRRVYASIDKSYFKNRILDITDTVHDALRASPPVDSGVQLYPITLR